MYTIMRRSLMFVLFFFILHVPQQSNAFRFDIFRKLAEGGNNPESKPIQMAPSPSPDSGNNLSLSGAGDGNVPAKSPKADPTNTVTNETCDMVSNSCRDHKNMIACIPFHGNGPQGSFLVVQNDGESSLKVKVTLLPVSNTYEDIEVPKHQAKKINISANVGVSSSVVLNAGNVDCVIHIGVPVPQSYKRFPYAAYMTPINGAYLLFVTAMIIGGTWTCCKLGRRGRHLDGVPYKELQMGQTEYSSMNMNMGTAEGWDQDWDEDWDEEKAVKSTGGNHVGNGLTNGRTSNSDGWGNDWDE